MPLIQGSSQASIRENIARLIKEGKKPDQAVAVANSIARQVRRKRKRNTNKAQSTKELNST